MVACVILLFNDLSMANIRAVISATVCPETNEKKIELFGFKISPSPSKADFGVHKYYILSENGILRPEKMYFENKNQMPETIPSWDGNHEPRQKKQRKKKN